VVAVAGNRRTLAPAREAVVALPRLHRLEAARLLPSGKVLVAAFASIAFAAGAYAVARATPMFALRRIEITGTDPAGRAEARRALADLRGRSLLAIGSGDVGRRLAELPDVATASYDRDFPHTLRVTIVPERPVAVLRRGAETWLVSAKARVLRKIPRGTFRSLPRVWAPESTTVAAGSRVGGTVAAMAAALARLRQAPLPRRVRGATDTETDGLVFLLDNGLAVRLGDASDIDLKLAVAARIVPLVPAGSTLLDVSVPERPVSQNSQVAG
jgi:cell division protein FtsQ